MGPTITVDNAKKDFDAVLNAANQSTGVWIKRGRLFYHVHREVSEDELLAGLQESVKESQSGKAKVLRSLDELD